MDITARLMKELALGAIALAAWTANAARAQTPARADVADFPRSSSATISGLGSLSATPDPLGLTEGPLGFGGSAPKPGKNDIRFRFGDLGPATNDRRSRHSIGVGGGLAEGKLLETLIWGGGGAVAGAVVGPLRAAVGGVVGAAAGLLVAIFAVPHNGPDASERRVSGRSIEP